MSEIFVRDAVTNSQGWVSMIFFRNSCMYKYICMALFLTEKRNHTHWYVQICTTNLMLYLC